VVNEQEYHENAKNSWQHSTTREFSQKTKFLAPDLRKWRRKKPRNSDLLAQIENQILDQQSLHPSQQNRALQKQLLEKHQNLMAKEGTYHIQRVKKRWAVVGDKPHPSFTIPSSKGIGRTTLLTSPTQMVPNPPPLINSLPLSLITSLISSPLKIPSTSQPMLILTHTPPLPLVSTLLIMITTTTTVCRVVPTICVQMSKELPCMKRRPFIIMRGSGTHTQSPTLKRYMTLSEK
jgi:hypothetical protein